MPSRSLGASLHLTILDGPEKVKQTAIHFAPSLGDALFRGNGQDPSWSHIGPGGPARKVKAAIVSFAEIVVNVRRGHLRPQKVREQADGGPEKMGSASWGKKTNIFLHHQRDVGFRITPPPQKPDLRVREGGIRNLLM